MSLYVVVSFEQWKSTIWLPTFLKIYIFLISKTGLESHDMRVGT